jgi:hypothetical protein
MTERRVVRVSVTDVDMPFVSMVRFMVKRAIAPIPAFLILMILGAFFWVLLGSFFLDLGSRLSRYPTDPQPSSSTSDRPFMDTGPRKFPVPP